MQPMMDRGSNANWGTSQSGPMIVEEKAAAPRATDRVTEQPTVRVSVATVAPDVTGKQSRPAAATNGRAAMLARVQIGGIIAVALVQFGLLMTALLPARIITDLGWTTSNGPFPSATAPFVTAVFYLLPFASGLLTKRWDVALLASTAPVWAAIGLFTVASSTQNGIFYFTKLGQPANLVGTFELFAALGFFGWVTRRVFTHQAE
jgi:hypothetical protein